MRSEVYRCHAGLKVLCRRNTEYCLALEEKQLLLFDPLVWEIVTSLAEPKNVQELVKQLVPRWSEGQILQVVSHLSTLGILVGGYVPPGSRARIAFWDTLSRSEHHRAHSVAITSIVPRWAESLTAMLNANEIATRQHSELNIILTDDYLRPRIEKMAHASERSFIAKPIGQELWMGPYLSKFLCFECLSFWLRMHRWPEISIVGRNLTPTSSAALSSTLNGSLALIATTVAVAGESPTDQESSALRIFAHATNKSSFHPIVRRRNCNRCVGGRTITLQELVPLLADTRTGLFTQIIRSRKIGGLYLSQGDVLLPLPVDDCRRPLPPMSVGGRGETPESAFESCVFEGIERHSATYVGDEELRVDVMSDADTMQHNDMLLFSESQLRDKRSLLCSDETQSTRWIRGHCLTELRDIWFPAGSVYLGCPYPSEEMCQYVDTTGCAAASEKDAAILHGLFELIERDAIAIWWYNKVRRPGIEISRLRSPWVVELHRFFKQQERSLEVLDITDDLGVPTYVAVSADSEGRDIFFGGGCSLCGVCAASKALSELLQLWYWNQIVTPDLDRQRWLSTGSLDSHPYLRALGVNDSPQSRKLETSAALSECTSRVNEVGIEVYWVDLTRPELGIPAVRVIAPGLRHHSVRLGPGRLYDVPVGLGWVNRKLRENEMNDVACII